MELLLVVVLLVLHVFGLLCLVRFLLYLSAANSYNQIFVSLARITEWLLRYLRPVLPRSARIDLAALIVVWLCHSVISWLQLVSTISEISPIYAVLVAAWMGVVRTVHVASWIYLIGIGVVVIMSWLAPNVYSPAVELSRQLTEPILGRIRRLLPPLAGMDFSPMVAMLLIFMINSYIVPRLYVLF